MFPRPETTEGATEEGRDVVSFVDELAELYAALWFAGRLEEIRQDEGDDRFDEG